MKKYIFILHLLFSIQVVSSQTNRYGIPELKNYTINDYDGEEQNWNIVKDKRGVYYIGKTSEGVLEFDGTNWTKIPITNKSTVRALAVGEDGVVYIGAVGELGRLKPDSVGKLQYESFLHLFRDTTIRNSFVSDVWKIYNYNNKVLFTTRQYLAFYDGDSITVTDMGTATNTGNLFTYLHNNELYIGSYKYGLHKLVGDTIQVVPNSDKLVRKNIFAFIEYSDDTVLIATNTSEFFLFSPKKNEFSTWNLKGKMTKYIEAQGAMLYNGIRMSNGNFAFGYVVGGKCSLIEVNKKGEILSLINTDYGLNDESVTNLFQESVEDNSKPMLWLSLNNGLASLDISSPIKKFNENNGLNGIILDIISYEGRIYVATMSGLYANDVDELGNTYFRQIPEIKTLTWTLAVFNDPQTGKKILLAGTGSLEGVFEVKGFKARRIFKEPEKHLPALITKKIYQSQKKPNRVYLALEGGVTWIEYNNGRWITTNEAFDMERLRGDIRSLGEDNKGNLWVGSYLSGIMKVKSFAQKDTIRVYTPKQGLPKYCGHMIESFNGRTYFGTDEGLFEYDELTDSMIQTPNFGGLLKGRNIHRIVKTSNGYAVSDASEKNKFVELLIEVEGVFKSNPYPFKVIPNTTADALYSCDSMLYIGASTTLYAYNLNDTLAYTNTSKTKKSFDVLIRKVYAGDALIHGGTYYSTENGKLRVIQEQPSSSVPHIKYIDNSINIDWSALWFLQAEKTQYSFMLEGYRDQWSAWSSEHKRDFTNLAEGNYTFCVKARNVYGVESNIAKFTFRILPPWYRTIYAYIAYVLLSIFVIVLILKIYTRRLLAEKERLERIVAERTAEVVAQKEEIEAQSEKIVAQNEQIKSSINYASKIQNAVLPPSDVIKRIFGDYFILYLPRDIVSGDFYWMAEIRGLKYCAVADCTGHGVPGGFMSMMGISFLNQIIGQEKNLTAGEILIQLRANIIHSLHQTGKVGENKDGMDIALYIIDPKTNNCQFAGANNPLVLIRNNEATVYKADKMPIGIYIKGDEPFKTQEFVLEEGDVLYTFSDGYVDQFGGKDKRKFMSKNFRELLLRIHQKTMAEQCEILNQTLLDWHGELDRVDDVVVMGYRHRDVSANIT